MKLAILFGAQSFEHEISIVSAATLKEKLSNFELSFIFCDQDHALYLIDPKIMMAKTFSSGEYKKSPVVTMIQGGFSRKKRFGSEEIHVDILNLIHGADGEDGTVAGLLDFYKINYIGPRRDASVFSYDKRYTKYLANAIGVDVVDYEVLRRQDSREIKTALPFIIKPSRLGSSIGVSVVKDESEIEYALDVAFEFDESVIIEPFIEGVKEYNLAGFGANGEMHYSIVEEPQKNDFLDFDKKYLDFSRSSTVNEAELSDVMATELKTTFSKIYTGLFEGALIRCDFFIVDGAVVLNEINPIPGSMANYLFKDFQGSIEMLLNSLPKHNNIKVDYKYIHTISAAKGK
ncbi:MAG: D-alanine--D-alanine ligase [Campylobacterota bacterium]|nr:D-alanine--D-alanine ligase [Campylobacterota bacterium]